MEDAPSSRWRSARESPVLRALLGLGAYCLPFAGSYLYWYRLYVHEVAPTASSQPGIRNLDPFTLFYPTMSYARERLLAGELPLWNPYQLCGGPFLATQYPTVLYPPFLATLFLPSESALSLLMWFHLALNGAFTFAFARALGARAPASLCAAAIFMFSGYALATPQANNLAFALPWTAAAFLATEKICQVRRVRWAILLGLALAMPIMVGGVQLLVYTAYGLAVYALFRIPSLAREGRRTIGIVALLFCLGGTIGLGLSAAQWMPGIELMGQGIRTMRRLTPHEFLAHPFRAVPVFESFLTTRPFDQMNVSVLGFAAASLAVSVVFRRPEALGLLVAGALALDFASGPAAFLYQQYVTLPGLGAFRVPKRALEVALLALAALCALGLSALIDEPRPARRFGMSAVACAVCVAIAVSTSGAARMTSIWGAGFFALCWGVPRSARWSGVLALAISVGYMQAASQANLDSYPAEHGAMGVMRDPERIFRALEASYPWGRAMLVRDPWVPNSLAPKTGTLLRFPVMGDYEPLLPRLYAAYLPRSMEGYEPMLGMYEGELLAGFLKRPALLDYLSLGYAVVRVPPTALLKALPALQEIHDPSFSPWRVFKNPNGLPHAYLATEAQSYASEEEVLDAMTTTAASTARVYLQGPEGTIHLPVQEIDPTRVIVGEPERVVVTTSSPAGGWLVLTDLYYPGWIVEVDGREVPILRANYLLRAVRIPGGEHRVSFLYRPRSVRVGMVASGATVCILLIGTVFLIRRPVRATPW